MKGGAGAGFIIMRPSASPRTGSWWQKGAVFPPQLVPAMSDYQSPRCRRTSNRGGARLRPERHNPHSITTLRIRITDHLLRQLTHCPFCGVLRLQHSSTRGAIEASPIFNCLPGAMLAMGIHTNVKRALAAVVFNRSITLA